MQSRRESLIETFTNIGIGFIISLVSQMVIFAWFGIHLPLWENVQMTIYFTIVSIIRSYLVRRWFNGRVIKKMQRELHESTA